MNANKHIEKEPQLVDWILLVILGLVWGSSYILIKRSLVAFSANDMAALRIGISAIAFLPLFILKFKHFKPKLIPYYATVGIMGSGIPALCFAIAQKHLSSSTAGVLGSLTPLFTLSWGLLFFGQPFKWNRVFAVIIGLLGAMSLILFSEKAVISGDLGYGLIIILATMCYGVSANTIGTYLKNEDSTLLMSTAFMTIGIPAIIYLSTSDFTQTLKTHPQAWNSLGYLAVLSILGTVISSIFYSVLIQRTSAVFATMVSYLMPISALSWGIIDGESIEVYHFIGMALILTGVYLSKK